MKGDKTRSNSRKTFLIRCKKGNVEYLKNKIFPKCGEIWYCNLKEAEGHIQNGIRPVIVLSNNRNNQYSTLISMAPITSQMKKTYLPCHVRIENYKEYGLVESSMILIEQTKPVQEENFLEKIGVINDPYLLKEISKAMKNQFPICNL